MVRKCSVKGCTAEVKHKFKFPQASTDKMRLLEWLAASGNSSLLSVSKKQLRMKGICKLHFEPKYILAKKLANTAVPTLHLPDAIDVSTYTIDNNNNSEPEPLKQQFIDDIKYPFLGDESDQQTVLLHENKSADDSVLNGAAVDSSLEGINSAVDSSNDNTVYFRDESNQQSIHRYENRSQDDTVFDGAAGDSPVKEIVSVIDFDIKQEWTGQNIQNANPSLVEKSINSTESQAVAEHTTDRKTQSVTSTVHGNEEKKVIEICTLYEAFVKAGLEMHLIKLHHILKEHSSEHTKNFIKNQLKVLITTIDNGRT